MSKLREFYDDLCFSFSLYTDYHSFSNACGASDYYDPMCVCIRQVCSNLTEKYNLSHLYRILREQSPTNATNFKEFVQIGEG